MPDLALISKAIDFVEDNLQEPVTVAGMADAAGYSLYYFCRVFNQATHHTPYDYLMRRRLSETTRALLRTDQKIIDVALDYQFNSPETYSRAFKRMFDIQPSQMRKGGYIDSHRLMPRLTLAHLEYISQGQYLKPVLVESEPCQLAGLMTLVRDDERDRLQLWQLFAEELARLQEQFKPGPIYGVANYAEGWESSGYQYLAAAETGGQTISGTALVLKPMPRLTCARFFHKGPIADLSLTLDYIYHTWLPKAGVSASHPWVIEHYGHDLPPASDWQSTIEIRIPLIT